MATNLRLGPEVADALRRRAAETGRPQADLMREALDQYLGLADQESTLERLIARGLVSRPTPFVDVEPWIDLPSGVSVLDLLDRDDR